MIRLFHPALGHYDFPFNEGENVVELGGGLAPLNPGKWRNVDVRTGVGVDVVADLNGPFPFKDGELDGAVSVYMIEHISWRQVRHFVRECARVLRPGGKLVLVTSNLYEQVKQWASTQPDQWDWEKVSQNLFGDQNYEGDEWRHNAHYVGWSPFGMGRLLESLGFEHVVITAHPETKTDMIVIATRAGGNPAPDLAVAGSPLKLNLGSYTNVLRGWVNIDIEPVYRMVPEDIKFIQHDLTKGLPMFEPRSVGLIYTSHMLEHVPLEAGMFILQECARVLAPGGVLRVSVPDARLLAERYLAGRMGDFNSEQDPQYIQAPTQGERFSRLLMHNHVVAWDQETLTHYLGQAGFKEIAKAKPGESRSPQMQEAIQRDLGIDKHASHSLILEAVK